MNSLWKDSEAKKFKNDLLALRVYTSQLLGKNSDLVLHGGGNTSVKIQEKNLFGEPEEILYVKGSGWDLATIEKQGFAPVKMDVLLKMAKLESLSDTEMVKVQRSAMTNPSAPNPSVEAILHAIIPYTFVDHTHADAVVTVTNTADGKKRVQDIYGNRLLIIPYVMPGFILAREIYKRTRGIDWNNYEGMILLNHGIFTFDNDAKKSYEQMIKLVSEAENYLKKKKAVIKPVTGKQAREDFLTLAKLRQSVSRIKGTPMLARLDSDKESLHFSNNKKLSLIATRGPLTPDHVIRTRVIPSILKKDPSKDVDLYAQKYDAYFERHRNGAQTRLDCAPRWVLWPGHGSISIGETVKAVEIVSDIAHHTMKAILQAECLGGWKALPEKDLFEMEYWELEQAKLKKGGHAPAFQGKVALVTGAASGIGRSCAELLAQKGAAVVALDIDPKIKTLFKGSQILGYVCDVTDENSLKGAMAQAIRRFGGLDVVVSNAGIFPASESIAQMRPNTWQKSLDINLSGHQRLLKECIPFLELGCDPAVIIVASKNVPAPGPGVSAYSVAKAGLTQLARVAALELADKGIRVNVVHPNQVFDTAIWTNDVLKKRAKHYNISVDEYKKSNLLKVSIESKDVAELVCTMAGPVFAKTTGAQVSIDGGNERVI